MIINRTLVTAPTAEPLTLTQAKLHLRVDSNADDARITQIITAVRQRAELYLRRALVTQTWKITRHGFPPSYPGSSFPLPYGTLQSVTHVKYYDADGTQQTLPTTVYEGLPTSGWGEICLKPDQEWPVTQYGKQQAVEVQFVCGYGSAAQSPETIPGPILEGLYLAIGDAYEHREGMVVGQGAMELPETAKTKMSAYRLERFTTA